MSAKALHFVVVSLLILGAFYALPSDHPHGSANLMDGPAVSTTFSFSDSTLADSVWADRIVIDINGGTAPTYSAEQHGFGLPGPSRYIIHTFTCDSIITTRMAEASWAATSFFDPEGETVQFVSFRFDIFAGNVAIHPVVVQSDTVYLGPSQQLFLPFVWKEYQAQELRASDFSVYATNRHPDFSQPMMFGYATHNSTPKQDNCPREIVTQTYVDNFQVRVNETLPTGGNHPPIAQDDILIARIDSLRAGYRAGPINVLYNDYDPDGDSLWIRSVLHDGTEGGFGSHLGGGDFEFVWHSVDTTHSAFFYQVTDGAATVVGKVLVLIDCACVISCWLGLNKRGHVMSQELDLDLIRRFRDEALATTEHGARFVDLYYNRMPEMLKLLIIDHPGLGLQAVQMVEHVQPALQNFLDSDGTMPFTQEQMDAVGQFVSDLSAVSSDSLKATIEAELTRLGPLDYYVGRPVSGVLETVLGDPISTGVEGRSAQPQLEEVVLEQNYPNPFNPTTTIPYTLRHAGDVTITVVDVLGRQVKELVSGRRPPGTYNVTFDSADLPSGVYFYRLQVGDHIDTNRMVLLK